MMYYNNMFVYITNKKTIFLHMVTEYYDNWILVSSPW